MLSVKHCVSRASSSLAVQRRPDALCRRFYADESSSKGKGRNAYADLLKTGNTDKDTIDDILAPPRKAVPDQPPRAPPFMNAKLPPSQHIKAAPLVGGVFDFPKRREQKENDISQDENMDTPPLEPKTDVRDAADQKASEVFKKDDKTSILLTGVEYRLYVTARSKNCIMTLVDENNKWRAGISSGRCGFRNANEGTYEAGYQCAIRIFEMIRREMERRREDIRLEIFLNGFGQGRGALLKALTMSEGDGVREIVEKLTDKTPIRIGGVRLQKSRRL